MQDTNLRLDIGSHGSSSTSPTSSTSVRSDGRPSWFTYRSNFPHKKPTRGQSRYRFGGGGGGVGAAGAAYYSRDDLSAVAELGEDVQPLSLYETFQLFMQNAFGRRIATDGGRGTRQPQHPQCQSQSPYGFTEASSPSFESSSDACCRGDCLVGCVLTLAAAFSIFVLLYTLLGSYLHRIR